ncbi:MAG: PAS domain-containing protein [Candidatus Hodarchaeota archaeon]
MDQQNRQLIDSLNYPFYVIDGFDYSIKISNLAFKSMFGEYKPTDKCYSITHSRKTPCTGKKHQCPLDEVKKKKKPIIVEHIHSDKKGISKIYEIHCYPIFDKENKVNQVIEYSFDITDRKRIEKSLQESKETLYETSQLLEQILDTTDILIAYMDQHFNFIKVNRAYALADEREPEFFIGRNHFDLYPNKENEEIFNRVVETKNPYFVAAKAFQYAEHPERGISYWDWSLIPIIGFNNTVMGLVLTLRDVTDRVGMQNALKASEEKFKSITELAHEIIMRIKPNGVCTYINRSGKEFFGKSKKDMIQSNILNFVHMNDLENMESFLARFDKEIKHIEEITINFIVPKGVRAIEWNASSITDDSGDLIEVQLSGRDITELQEELIEMNKLAAVGQLAAGVAHEMNSPLANISLKAEYLLNIISRGSSNLEVNLLKRELEGVKKEVKLGSKIVTHLLQFSRKIHLTTSNLKIKSLISELISSPINNTRLLEKKINIVIEIEDDLEIVGDRILLLQVFQNLLNNSIDAFENREVKPQINFEALRIGNKIEIKVTDNGIGIKKVNLKRVFEPFFSTKPIGKGTGLGLSICRGIIEKHKGEIKINSSYGYGTEILIILPIES